MPCFYWLYIRDARYDRNTSNYIIVNLISWNKYNDCCTAYTKLNYYTPCVNMRNKIEKEGI